MSADVVVLSSSGPLPVTLAVPNLSANLAYRISRMRDAVPEWSSITASEVLEVMMVLPRFEDLCRPAPMEVIRSWMDFVALGVAALPTDDTLRARVMVVADTSGDLPRACWTAETRRAFSCRGAREANFLPSDAAVDAFLRPIGTDLLRQRGMLRRLRDKALALAGQAPEPIKPESAEEREAVSARFNAQLTAAHAELAAGGSAGSRPGALIPAASARGPDRRATLARAQCGSACHRPARASKAHVL